MEYITERRGGWDEWGDEYEAIMGVCIGGEEFSRFIDDGAFTDADGNEVEVEFPMRDEIDSEILIERYEPEYEVWVAHSLSEFEEAVDVDSMTVAVSELSEKEF